MPIVNATNARANFYKIVDETLRFSEPTIITSKKGNVVMLSEDDYKAMEETLYLTSIPGMEKKIIDGINENLDVCAEDTDG